jgi:L-lactate dehydrogenase complex protein LldF
VRTYADAMRQLRLLARSATAQHLTSYTTFITGPDRPDKELHIVFVDNGRLAMREDPAFREALRCIRCAACANVCPPYQVVGGHVFGYIYSGAIGLVNTPFHHGLAHAAGPQSLCVSCNACATVCPVAIPLPRQILAVRARVAAAQGLPLAKRLVLAVWSRPAWFDAACRLGALASAPLASGPFLRRLPLPAAWRWRTPPRLARRPARDRLAALAERRREDEQGVAGAPWSTARTRGLATAAMERTTALAARTSGATGLATAATGVTVACFLQCLVDRFLPEVAEATVAALQACGARVVVPAAQPCCGLPALDAGDRQTARRMARATIGALEAVDADYVVTPAASCVVAVVHDYPELFADDPAWRARAMRLAARVLDLPTFLTDVARLDAAGVEGLPAASGGPLTYHPFCQSTNVLGRGDAPRALLADVLGLDVRPLGEAGVCCGFGGSTSLEHPAVAAAIAARKLANVAATGAPLLVTDNPGCLLHLRGVADAAGQALRVQHLAEVVAARLAQAGGAALRGA